MDGERNALYYRPLAQDQIKIEQEIRGKYLQKGVELLRYSQILDGGEGLSAISLVKRFFAKGEGFPSTPRIALLNVIDEIENSAEGIAFCKYFIEGRSGSSALNEQLYFEENLNAPYLRKNGYQDLIDNGRLSDIQRCQNEIAKKYGKEMSKYYALLVFDGDSMGKIWSGDLLAGTDRLEELQSSMSRRLQVFQVTLARRLGIFAAYAKAFLDGKPEKPENPVWEIVLKDPAYQQYIRKFDNSKDDFHREKGKCIYAGGDDFLGFVNLKFLFPVMKELRKAYDALVSEPLAEYIGSTKLTYSAGVAIAHYKTPLKEVLRWAREMEHNAKKIDDKKDAFAIAVLKHSGEIESTRYKWTQQDAWFIEDFDALVRELNTKRMSNTFIKAIGLEFSRLSDRSRRFPTNDFVYTEFTRLIRRSCNLDNEDRQNETDMVTSHVRNLYDGAFVYDSVSKQISPEVKSLSTFMSALNVCDFIKRETVHEQE